MRRRLVLGGLLAAPLLGRAQGRGRVVVVGGGFAGATAARALAASHDVTLIEAEDGYVACPFSNEVIVEMRGLDAQRFEWDGVAAAGVRVVRGRATGVDGAARRVGVGETGFPYDRLILAPGVDLRLDGALPGYDPPATERMPHAWKAGAQTVLLRAQLQEMRDGGVVVMAVPANPYRCPPGPYERASLMAWWLKGNKPRSKLIVLDAKDVFSKQKLFQQAWATLYPGIVEWISLSDGGKVTGVDAKAMTLTTDFQTYRADVANVIPPQRAGAIAVSAGVTDRTGWCPVDPVTFESTLVPGVHVIGDAAIMGAMPKSAFSANAQALVCAEAVAAALAGREMAEPRLINTCYSLAGPGYGFSVAGVYRPVRGQLTEIEGAGGTSALDAGAEVRSMEATYGEAWFKAITGSVFG